MIFVAIKNTVMESSFFDSALFSYFIMPLLIFLARICDVSIGTMRIIFVSKGKKNIAPFLGIFPSKKPNTSFLFGNVLRHWRGGK